MSQISQVISTMTPDIDALDTTDVIDIEPVTQSLNQALLATPFDMLGLHTAPSNKGLVLRTWHPDAESVEVVTLPEGKITGHDDQPDRWSL